MAGGRLVDTAQLYENHKVTTWIDAFSSDSYRSCDSVTVARKWVKDYDFAMQKGVPTWFRDFLFVLTVFLHIGHVPLFTWPRYVEWNCHGYTPCSQVPREEIFLTTKIWSDDFGWEKARLLRLFCFISSRGVDLCIKLMPTNIGRELVTKLCGSPDICQSTYTVYII